MKEGVPMKKKLTIWLLVATMCVLTACYAETETETPKVDSKPAETETTNGDIVGDDAESQMTTSEADKTSDDNESDTGNTSGTSGEEKKPDNEQNSSSTVKPSGDNRQENSTEKTPVASTTKNETTTAKPAPTTTKPTTTPKPTTTSKPTTTASGGGNTGGGYVELDIEPSAVADTAATNIIKSIINSSMNQYARVKAIHDWIVKNVDYDYDGLLKQESQGQKLPDSVYKAEGALCNKLAVCQGYAEAFELLCAKAGVQAYMIYGDAGNDTDGWQSHAWNVVKIDGEWYQIDCTWDDPLMNGDVITDGSNITYQYFLLTDNEMYADHVVDTKWSKNLKVCTSTLYKGYAEKLSVDAAMAGSSNSCVVSTAEEFKQTIESYASKGTMEFAVAVPASAGTTSDMISSAVRNGFEKGNITGSYNISCSTRNVCSYVVYVITLTKK